MQASFDTNALCEMRIHLEELKCNFKEVLHNSSNEDLKVIAFQIEELECYLHALQPADESTDARSFGYVDVIL